MKREDLARLGSLSERYESNGDPGAISSGRGDPGGASYGKYQLALKAGTPARFVAFLRRARPAYYGVLAAAPPGTPGFNAAWKALAAKDRAGFGRAQHEFVMSEYYLPASRLVEAGRPGLELMSRSKALNDSLWSAAVQHGVKGALNVFTAAVRDADAGKAHDADLIRAVYAERGRTGPSGCLVHFPNCSPQVQHGVAARFQRELADALAALDGDPDAR